MEIQPLQIIFQIINFSVVLGALTYLLYKPILKIFDERARRIEEAQVAADKVIADQAKSSEVQKQIRQKAEKEAAQLMEEAQATAQTKRASTMTKAKEEALQEVDRLRLAWQDEKRKNLQEMKSDFAKAVITASEKVVGQSLDAKAHAKLIENEFNQLLKSV